MPTKERSVERGSNARAVAHSGQNGERFCLLYCGVVVIDVSCLPQWGVRLRTAAISLQCCHNLTSSLLFVAIASIQIQSVEKSLAVHLIRSQNNSISVRQRRHHRRKGVSAVDSPGSPGRISLHEPISTRSVPIRTTIVTRKPLASPLARCTVTIRSNSA